METPRTTTGPRRLADGTWTYRTDMARLAQTRPDLVDAAARMHPELACQSGELILHVAAGTYKGGLAQLATDSRLAPLT